MGLQAELQAKIGKAFDEKLSDAVASLTLSQKAVTFNPVDNTTSEVVTNIATRGVVGDYALEELNDTSVKPTDVKITVLQNELSVEPKIDDIVNDGVNNYKIINIKKDPAKVIWKLQCRR